MTKKEFLDYMEIFFDSLERSAGYYWEYKNRLKEFELINRLAYASNLINSSVFVKTDNFIQDELQRYEK